MGCDIHLTAEYKDPKTKEWKVAHAPIQKCEYCDGTGKDDDAKSAASEKDKQCWFCKGKGKRVPDFYEGRNYDDFAILASVRNGRGFAGIKTGGGFNPIAEPRGVPKNATDEYKAEVRRWDCDGHSHSFITLKELLDYDWEQTTSHQGVVSLSVYADWWRNKGKKGAPQTWCGGVSGGDIVMVSNKEMEKLILANEDKVKPAEKVGFAFDDVKIDGKSHHTVVEWTETYRESATNLQKFTIPLLQAYAEKKGLKPQDVRIVFFFDN